MSSFRSSNIDEVVLDTFAEKGLLPPKEVAHWRVLHIAGFITVYEAFIGMKPHVDLFWWIFSGWALSEGKPPRIAQVGGFALQKRPKPSVPYLAYSPSDSNWGWHGEWFYIRNSVEVSFPTFTEERPKRRESWSWGPALQQNRL